MESQVKPGVDITKFFFAVNIVFLHYGIIEHLPYSELVTAMVTRLAVPFFFVASGYFWGRKIYAATDDNTSRSLTIHYCKRLGWKLLIFEPISIMLFIADNLIQNEPVLETCISVVQGIFFYPSGSLWYIQAVIVAVILLTPFAVRQRELWCVIPALVLYFIGALGNRYFFLIDDTVIEHILRQYDEIFVTTRNGIFFGFPFVLLGTLVARFEKQIVGRHFVTTKRILFLSIASYFLCFVEYLYVTPQIGHGDNALYLSYLLVAPLLFVLTTQINGIRWNTTILRSLSTSIYLLHRPIGNAVKLVFTYVAGVDSMLIISCTGLLLLVLICLVVYKKKPARLYYWLT